MIKNKRVEHPPNDVFALKYANYGMALAMIEP